MRNKKERLGEGTHVISQGEIKREIVKISKEGKKYSSETIHQRKNRLGEWITRPVSKALNSKRNK